MKKLIFCFFLFAATLQVNAQTAKGASFAIDQTVQLTEKYQLSAEQVEQMQVIQQRKIKNFADIQSLMESDPEKYQAKMKSIHFGTNNSIRKMLNRDQLKIYQQMEIDKRKKKADRISKMKESGASMDEIKKAMIQQDFE